MRIEINSPIVEKNDLIICDPEAVVEVRAKLASTAGNIYICAKQIIIRAPMEAKEEILLKGSASLNGPFPKAFRLQMGSNIENFPKHLLGKTYMSPNLQKKVTIIEEKKAA